MTLRKPLNPRTAAQLLVTVTVEGLPAPAAEVSSVRAGGVFVARTSGCEGAFVAPRLLVFPRVAFFVALSSLWCAGLALEMGDGGTCGALPLPLPFMLFFFFTSLNYIYLNLTFFI